MRVHIVSNYLAIVHGICDDLSEFNRNIEKTKKKKNNKLNKWFKEKVKKGDWIYYHELVIKTIYLV